MGGRAIGEISSTKFRVKNWVTQLGSPSQTRFEQQATGNQFSLFRIYPETGRTHQIRIHAAWCGLHLVGDKKYHPNEDIYLEYLDKGFTQQVRDAVKYERLCLHACELAFIHPEGKTRCVWSCPVPNDMKKIWSELTST